MILVANVGNRNLQFEGRNMMTHPQAVGKTFLDFTERVFKNKNHQGEFGVAIIDKVLERYDYKFQKIVLIGTNQNSNDDNRDNSVRAKDTLYAAEIVAEKLREEPRLKRTAIEVLLLECYLDRTTDVMQWYKNEMNELVEKHPVETYLLVDSGGAPQMKSAMKLTAEYVLPTESYEVLYVSNETNTVIPVEQVEYKKIIASYQIETLVGRLNYDAAKQIWEDSGNAEFSELTQLLEFGAKRRSFIIDGIKKDCEYFESLEQHHPVSKHYRFLKASANESAMDATVFYRIAFMQAFAEKCILLGDYNNLVITARQFMEYVVAGYLIKLTGYNILNDGSKAERLMTDLLNKHKILFNNQTPAWHSFGARKEILKKSDIDGLTPILESFDFLEGGRNNSGEVNRLYKLRNEFAHFGKSISKSSIEKHCPDLFEEVKKWRMYFEFGEENLFDIVNVEIHKTLKTV